MFDKHFFLLVVAKLSLKIACVRVNCIRFLERLTDKDIDGKSISPAYLVISRGSVLEYIESAKSILRKRKKYSHEITEILYFW